MNIATNPERKIIMTLRGKETVKSHHIARSVGVDVLGKYQKAISTFVCMFRFCTSRGYRYGLYRSNPVDS